MTRTRHDGLPPISVGQKWIVDPNEPDTYIKLLQTNDTVVDSVSKIDLNPYVLTEYEFGVRFRLS